MGYILSFLVGLAVAGPKHVDQIYTLPPSDTRTEKEKCFDSLNPGGRMNGPWRAKAVERCKKLPQ